MMLFSSLIRLHALTAGALPQTQGHFALAAFLDIVQQVDPALSAELHDGKANKPFTLSQLNGLPARGKGSGETHLRAGHECWLRVTLAGEALFGTFTRRFLRGEARPTVRLGAMEFGVSEVLTAPGSHQWAGYTTTEALLAGARDEDLIALEFASPFSFSLGDNRAEIRPQSDLIFGGLQKKWAQWCGLPLPAPAPDREWLRERALIADWEMRSRMMRFGGQMQLGSVGWAVFRLFNAEADTRRALNALADFSFFAGIGRKTTQGMGQVRRMDHWAPPDEADGDSLRSGAERDGLA